MPGHRCDVSGLASPMSPPAARTVGHAASLRALEISVSVAFSLSLTATPPMPRNPPSLAASATCWLIWHSQPLKAAASPGALASTTGPRLPHRLDGLRFDVGGLAAGELFLQAVACGASALRGVELGDDGLDERVRIGVHLGLRQHGTACEALLEHAPEPARLG